MRSIEATDSLRRANRSYYEAFESRNFDDMSGVWEHSDRVLCTHPGWAALHGWGSIAGAFYALFTNDESVQFILTDESAHIEGNVGWVSVDENILGTQGGAMVTALNVFVRADADAEWKLVCHQASLVSPPTEDVGESDPNP